MAKTKETTSLLDRFSDHDSDVPELELKMPPRAEQRPERQTIPLDLSGRKRIVMAFGAGRSGKSTLLKWGIERSFERGEETIALATLDVDRPTLWHAFPDGCMMPKSSAVAMTYLDTLLRSLMRSPITTAVDFGADMSLVPLLRQVPGLLGMTEAAGLTMVALYLMSPRAEDLTVLAAMLDAGFQPSATALILNTGFVEEFRDPEREFAAVRRHSVYKRALAGGATEVWMPKLYAPKAVEERRISFTAAQTDPTIHPYDQERIKTWLLAMPAHLAPILSWLP